MNLLPWSYRDGDVELAGELYPPSVRANGATVLVVHEADGIGGNVRRHCAMLAELGYLAAAVDMHGGGRVLEGEEMQTALHNFRADPYYLRRRLNAAFLAIQERRDVDRDRIGAIGFCFGGTAVLELARSGAPLKAVASFHGLLSTSAPANPGAIKTSILVATGALDPLVPAGEVRDFQAEMSVAEADWHLIVHGRALHSFTNKAVDALGDTRMAYDPVAHQLSWAALQAFLSNALKDAPSGQLA